MKTTEVYPNFMVTKSYPKDISTSKGNKKDERVVQFEIQTAKPLPLKFDMEFAEFLNKYC